MVPHNKRKVWYIKRVMSLAFYELKTRNGYKISIFFHFLYTRCTYSFVCLPFYQVLWSNSFWIEFYFNQIKRNVKLWWYVRICLNCSGFDLFGRIKLRYVKHFIPICKNSFSFPEYNWVLPARPIWKSRIRLIFMFVVWCSSL